MKYDLEDLLTQADEAVKQLYAAAASAIEEKDLHTATSSLARIEALEHAFAQLDKSMEAIQRLLPKDDEEEPEVEPGFFNAAQAEPEEEEAAEGESPERRARRARVELQDNIREFMAKTRTFADLQSMDNAGEARAKSLICLARMLESDAEEFDESLRPGVLEELKYINPTWDRLAKHREFFGFNLMRRHKARVWELVSEGYELLAAAEECTTWLEQEPDVSDRTLKQLFDAAAAAESYLSRVFEDKGMGVWDSQQRDIHRRLEDIRPPEFTTRWWRRTGHDVPRLEEIQRMALGLEGEYKRARKAYERNVGKVRSIGRLKNWLEQADEDPNFEENLKDFVLEALDSGVSSNSVELRETLVGYSDLVESLEHKGAEKLAAYIRKDEEAEDAAAV
jgi:hypothetical protein